MRLLKFSIAGLLIIISLQSKAQLLRMTLDSAFLETSSSYPLPDKINFRNVVQVGAYKVHVHKNANELPLEKSSKQLGLSEANGISFKSISVTDTLDTVKYKIFSAQDLREVPARVTNLSLPLRSKNLLIANLVIDSTSSSWSMVLKDKNRVEEFSTFDLIGELSNGIKRFDITSISTLEKYLQPLEIDSTAYPWLNQDITLLASNEKSDIPADSTAIILTKEERNLLKKIKRYKNKSKKIAEKNRKNPINSGRIIGHAFKNQKGKTVAAIQIVAINTAKRKIWISDDISQKDKIILMNACFAVLTQTNLKD